jgi:hypothetical protein
MATNLTYDSLLQTLQRYIERGTNVDTEVYAQLPYLINQAERDIADKLKILGLKNFVVGAFVAGDSVYAKPDRWRQTAYINFGTGVGNVVRTPIFPRSLDYCRTYWPNPVLRDVPKFYSDYDYLHWLVVPTPDAAYPFEVSYYQQPPLLDSSVQSNWISSYAPNLLLYGTLLQCAPFLRNDERIQTWQSYYSDQLGTIDTEDLQRIVDNTTTRQED